MFVKTEIFKSIAVRSPVRLPISYWLFVCLRFLLTIAPQQGYIHPDEFFQNIEVIAGDILNVEVSRTWEFDPRFPIRNMFIPKLIIAPPIYFIRILNPYFVSYLNIDLKTPYYLLVIPRLFICLLSFINDYCLYKICILFGQNFRNRLQIFASSYVVLVYCCRSFSNTFEMVFFSILLLIVAECMLKSDKVIYHNEFLDEKYKKAKSLSEKVKIYKLKTHLPEHSLNRVFLLASVVVLGIFNRPTFAGFALPPTFFWINRGLGSKVVGFKDFHIRIFTLVLCAIPMVIFLIIIDSNYYGYLLIADLEAKQISWDNWVVTPLNFLRYNLDVKNLTRHGLHPWWMHLVVNIPLLFNVLGFIAYLTLIVNTYRFIRGCYSKLPRIQSITGLMLFCLVIPIAILSLFPHQEARFIIPVLFPLVYLYGNHLHANESDTAITKKLKKFLLSIWYIMNVLLTVFLGFVHQGGIYPFANHLYREIKSNYGTVTHIVTTHSYSIPTFLLQLESTSTVWFDKKTNKKYRLAPSTFINKYGSMPPDDLLMVIDDKLTELEMMLHQNNKKYRFYVASPCSLEQSLLRSARRYHYFELSPEYSYYPHFCTEAMPKFPSTHDISCIDKYSSNKNESQAITLNILQRTSCFVKRFCLRLYRVKTVGKTTL